MSTMSTNLKLNMIASIVLDINFALLTISKIQTHECLSEL